MPATSRIEGAPLADIEEHLSCLGDASGNRFRVRQLGDALKYLYPLFIQGGADSEQLTQPATTGLSSRSRRELVSAVKALWAS
jgi:hypothetical protein